jgi:hypothetical protein
VTTLLLVVLATEVLIRLVPSGYEDAAPLIPLLAAGLMGPSIMRQVSRSVSIPHKRVNFILSVVSAALIFVASTVVLAPELDAYAAPISMIIAFTVAGGYLLLRGQLGEKPVRIPYWALLAASAAAAAAGAGFHFLDPGNAILQIALAVTLFGGYLWGMVLVGIVPRQHRRALFTIARGLRGRPASGFRPRRALKRLDPADREALRLAIREKRPVEEIPGELATQGMELPPSEGGAGNGAAIGLQLVAAVRRAAREGGTPVPEPDDGEEGDARDSSIADFLFPTGTAAQRDAGMRGLLSGGLRGEELLTLEAVVDGLSRIPRKVWKEQPQQAAE